MADGAAPTYGFGDVIWWLFWLLFLILMLEPVMSMRRLHAARLSLIREMERKYGWRVITMIHREERVSFFGIPIQRFINIEDSEAVLRAIRTTPPDKPIALILHTPGGLVLAASQIAMALKRHPGKKIVIVPHYAMSGGTLIALAADEILMDPNAVLGPLDPQLALGPQGPVVPAPSIVKVAKMKKDKAADTTLIVADVAEKAIMEMQETIVELLKDKMGEDKAKELAKILTEGRWTHDYPITVEKARELGLPVKTEVPPEVYELMELYPQAPGNRPGVEYIPQPLPTPSHRQHGGNTRGVAVIVRRFLG
ncbi:ATP-dependent Clp protease proteolytic subunit [Pyrofollis japonicus]|uniref:SDH family Clp fold serine proteinase n=1 Tax=Pyrofollis japonicus TaxID=3060460 RepID=UPI00295B45CE|nr:ATP-dependent Clp protease proteolytic subunit [Pyrofollis japonicus]BEP17809.1 ATP-dependent Clp protease proteolytic subunit [Pyrofollis japonicus]